MPPDDEPCPGQTASRGYSHGLMSIERIASPPTDPVRSVDLNPMGVVDVVRTTHSHYLIVQPRCTGCRYPVLGVVSVEPEKSALSCQPDTLGVESRKINYKSTTNGLGKPVAA